MCKILADPLGQHTCRARKSKYLRVKILDFTQGKIVFWPAHWVKILKNPLGQNTFEIPVSILNFPVPLFSVETNASEFEDCCLLGRECTYNL